MLCLWFSLICAVVVLVDCDNDREWMRNTLKFHFSLPRHHGTFRDFKTNTTNFIRNQFREYGLETIDDTFTADNKINGTNIIGILKGKNFKKAEDKIVGVAAHYDTVRGTPGVNDNGGGVVAMLLAAKKVASQPNRKHTVIFVAFDLKEWENVGSDSAFAENGLCGSKHFFREWVPSFLGSMPNIAGVIVMDTIMNFDEARNSQNLIVPGNIKLFPESAEHVTSDDYQGDFLAIIGRPADDELLNTFMEQYKRQGKSKYEIEQFRLSLLTGDKITTSDITRYKSFMQSDHVTLWLAGIPAILITDTGYLRGYMKDCFHKWCDTMDKVTDDMIDFAIKTSNAVVATVNQLSPINSGLRIVPGATLFLSFILGTLLMWN